MLVLAGVVVLLYPVLATQYNNVRQHENALLYGNQTAQLDRTELETGLTFARSYNEELPGVPILDPWLKDVARDPGSDQYRSYSDQLDLFDAMARVRVPDVGIDLPVYHGTTDDVITTGAGHLYGTSLPVGGTGTHAVLTSHTGMSNATLFDSLIDVAEGDLMFIDVLGETLAYRVDQIKVVLPTEIGDLRADPQRDLLTLFTCTPYAVNSHRLLVRGERVDWSREIAAVAEQSADATSLEPWMWWLLGGAAVGAGAVTVIAVLERRRAGQGATRPGR